MRGFVLVVIAACGEPRGRIRDPAPAGHLPDIWTGSSTGDVEPPPIDMPRWPDLPVDDDGTSGSGGPNSTGDGTTAGSTAGETGTNTTSGTSTSAADASSSGTTGEAGSNSSSSTGPAPTGCPCEPGITGFCDLPPGTCPPTAPGGYCDPNGNGDYLDGDFTQGFLDWKAECG